MQKLYNSANKGSFLLFETIIALVLAIFLVYFSMSIIGNQGDNSSNLSQIDPIYPLNIQQNFYKKDFY